MKTNVGSADKVVRVILALVLFSLFFILEGNLRFLALIGLIPLLTAVMGYCPLYGLLSLNTCSLREPAK